MDVTVHALTQGSSNVQLFNLIALNSFGHRLTLNASGSTVDVVAAATPEPSFGPLLACGLLALLAFYKLRPQRGDGF